jgi:site-specific recombinase XerD
MRNFGFGKNLDNVTILRIAKHVAKERGCSVGSVKKIISALQDFSRFLRSEHEIRDLAKVEQKHFGEYAQHLKEKLKNKEISSATTACYISAINTVFSVFGSANHVSAKQCGIQRGDCFPNVNKSASNEVYVAVLDDLMTLYGETTDIRYLAMRHSIILQRTGGLTYRESVMIKIANKDLSLNRVDLDVRDGVINKRPRTIQVKDISGFIKAQQFVSEHSHTFMHGSLIPSYQTYNQYKYFAYTALSRVNERVGSAGGFLAYRYDYAQEIYRLLWFKNSRHHLMCPAEARKYGAEWIEYAIRETSMPPAELKALDEKIRMAVSEQLGISKGESRKYLGRSPSPKVWKVFLTAAKP